MRLALLVSYDGTPYRGWTDLRDVALRPALARVLGCPESDLQPGQQPSLPLLEAASRTDAGVHAAGQVCTLSLDDAVPPDRRSRLDTARLAYSLNALLPPEVCVRCAALVADGFDVRSNVGKQYTYRLSTASTRDPLRRLHEWHAPPRRGRPGWDAAAVASTAAAMLGTHSFAAFGNRPRGGERSVKVDPVCTLSELRLSQGGLSEASSAGRWAFTVRGDRFLYKMVRNLVGSLVKVGYGEMEGGELLEALADGRFRRGESVPITAPPHGLVLDSVEYAAGEDPFSSSSAGLN